jgi:hypothetical protein
MLSLVITANTAYSYAVKSTSYCCVNSSFSIFNNKAILILKLKNTGSLNENLWIRL